MRAFPPTVLLLFLPLVACEGDGGFEQDPLVEREHGLLIGDDGPIDDIPGKTPDAYEIQRGLFDVGTWLVLEDVVVTGVGDRGFFVAEEPGGPWSGLWVHVGDNTARGEISRGDRVTVRGELAELQWGDAGSVTSIDSRGRDGGFEVTGRGVEPEPYLVTTRHLVSRSLAERFEGVLVVVEEVEVTHGALPRNEFEIDRRITVDDLLYDFGPVYTGDRFEAITGVVHHSWGEYKLEPRGADDFVGYRSQIHQSDQVRMGDVIFTEVMIDPERDAQGAACPDAAGQYLELYNASEWVLDLRGLLLTDTSSLQDNPEEEPTYLDERLLLAPGERALGMQHEQAHCWGVQPDFVFWFHLDPAGEVLTLSRQDGQVIDTIDYGQLPVAPGRSTLLDPDAHRFDWNDEPAAWCLAQRTIASGGDLGSPGGANDQCPSVEHE